ncbi:unnamed protein product [Tilletia controversa]|uniref:Extracellular membrane protein CFEM domain-containing protein n=3 Tax=Tilletia TaxID=13289 RepID=A0A8X7MT28_9BASI|nr:hypothetical protein CF336_g3794 [Tilletia laevis]KAE8198726.1 hypothetical protein CF328_g3468 [Tilletia controversa]KAE8261613.1 hypothetical protein A4X03_0g3106 [Tilletia caries]KAE8203616.1 hypothetical protein CF335_g2951 [Tilletia laevis]KAE8247738.1 hypothetical protein A4X06_0g4229 [Tilletia controversa]
MKVNILLAFLAVLLTATMTSADEPSHQCAAVARTCPKQDSFYGWTSCMCTLSWSKEGKGCRQGCFESRDAPGIDHGAVWQNCDLLCHSKDTCIPKPHSCA